MQFFTRRAWIFVGIAAAVAAAAWLLAYLFAGVLVIFAGILFGVFLKNLADRLSESVSLRYEVAFAIVVASLLLIVAAAALLMGAQMVDRVDRLWQQLSEAQSQFLARIDSMEWWNRLAENAQDKQVMPIASSAVSTATTLLKQVLVVVGGFALVLFLGFYFALQWEKYVRGMPALVPREHRPRTEDLLEKVSENLWRWMLGRLIGMAAIGVTSALGLWAIGIPLPITLGVLAGLLNFIPNIGPLISAIPPLLMALQQGGNAVVYVLVLFGVLQFVESYFLTPLITQRQVSLPPGLTLSAQLLFGIAAGFLGLLLATPIVLVGFVAIRELYVEPEDA